VILNSLAVLSSGICLPPKISLCCCGGTPEHAVTTMLIKVKTLTGKEIELDIDLEDKITRIKEKVEEQSGVPPQQQRLIFGGRQMPDDKTAREFNITAGSVLHLVLALRGGL